MSEDIEKLHEQFPSLDGHYGPFPLADFREAIQSCQTSEQLKQLLDYRVKSREADENAPPDLGDRWIAFEGEPLDAELLRKLEPSYPLALFFNDQVDSKQARFLLSHKARRLVEGETLTQEAERLEAALGVAALEGKLEPDQGLLDQLYHAALAVQQKEQQNYRSSTKIGEDLMEGADCMQDSLLAGHDAQKLQKQYLSYRRNRMVPFQETDPQKGKISRERASKAIGAHPLAAGERLVEAWEQLPTTELAVEIRKRVERGECDLLDHPGVRNIFWEYRNQDDRILRFLLMNPDQKDFMRVWNWYEAREKNFIPYWIKKGKITADHLELLPQRKLEKLLQHQDQQIRQTAMRAAGQNRAPEQHPSSGHTR